MSTLQLLQDITNAIKLFYNAYVLKADACYTSTTLDKPYHTNGVVDSQGCNAIQFTNQGGGDVVINSAYTLAPGETRSINQCMPYVRDNTQYRLTFSLTDTNPNVIVTTTNITISRGAS